MGLMSKTYEAVTGQPRPRRSGLGALISKGADWLNRNVNDAPPDMASFQPAPQAGRFSSGGQIPGTDSASAFGVRALMPSVSSTPSFQPDPIGDIAKDATDQIMGEGRFRKIGGFLAKHGSTIADVAGAAGDAYLDYKNESRQDELFKRNRDEWNRKAALREAAMAGLLNTNNPDLSELFAEPEERYRRVNVGSRV